MKMISCCTQAKTHVPVLSANPMQRMVAALALVGMLLVAGTAVAAMPFGRRLMIEPGGTGLDLRWLVITDAVYHVQESTNLPGSQWATLATITGRGSATNYPVAYAEEPFNAYRVVFPQPTILAAEPAFLPEGSGIWIYIQGTCFYEGDGFSIGGITATGVQFFGPNLLCGFIPGLPPGVYGVEVFNVVGATLVVLPDAVTVGAATDQVLQEPPWWPPAGPAAWKKEFKGHVTLLKAFDDEEPEAAARKHTKTGHVTLLKAFDDEEPPPAARKHTKTGHVTLMKAFDDEEPPTAARTHTKTGHVTLLKAFDDEEPPTAARTHTKSGHVTLLKAFDDEAPAAAARTRTKSGHVSLLKAFDDENGDALVALYLSKKGYDFYQVQSPMSSARGVDKKDIRRGHSRVDEPEVRLHSGEVQMQVCDLAVAGRGLDFAWVRTYRSRTGRDTAQGTRWTHSYDVRCVTNGTAIDVYDGSGRRDTFRLQTNGVYTCPGIFREGTLVAGVFRLTFADTGFWEFNALGAAPAAGRLARIQDRNGNAIALAYDGAGRLATIEDTLGRTQTVAYTAGDRVASVTDHAGRTVTYVYYALGDAGGSTGDLKSVISPAVTGTPNGNDYPSGKTTTYVYASGNADDQLNHLLTDVVDPQGQTVARCIYDTVPGSPSFLRCVALQNGAELPSWVSYVAETPSPANRFAALRCIVNDPVGNVTESSFDARNRCVAQREFAGRAMPDVPVTDTVNRPSGRLRAGDPEFYDTRIDWNADNLCTRLVLPGGLVGSFVHGGDIDPACRMRKRPEMLFAAWDNELAERGADTDGDGVDDLFKIEYQYTYDPRFGTDPSAPNVCMDLSALEERLKAIGLLARTAGGETPIVRGSALGGFGGSLAGRHKYKGWDGTIKVTDATDDDCNGFATTATDPRGTVTATSYDAKGNPVQSTVSLLYPPVYPITVDRVYDAYGQLVALTNVPDATGYRSVTTYGWVLGHLHDCTVDAAVGGLNVATVWQRDNRGNVTNVIDPSGRSTAYTYNALDQLVACSSPPHGDAPGQRVASSLFYDANDNLVRVDTDNRRETGDVVIDNPLWTTRYAYDALDRLVAVENEVTAAATITNRFEYDANGQCIAALSPPAVAGTEPDNRVACAYDERGLLFRCMAAPGSPIAATNEYAYTGDAQLASVLHVDPQCVTMFAYDGLGRLQSVTDNRGNNENWNFNGAGDLLLHRVHGETNDVDGSAGNRLLAESRWSYNGLGRRVHQADSFFDIATGLPIDDGVRTTLFAYASNDQLTHVTNDLGHAVAYGYDTAGRLAVITGPRGDTRVHVRDAYGNVTRVTDSELSDLGGAAQTFVTDYAYDSLDRLVAVTDNVGNTNRWFHDGLDRVVRVASPRGNETRYRYDGLGRCIDETAFAGPCDMDTNGVDRGITINTTHVEYDTKGRVIAVTDVNATTTAYAYDARNRVTTITCADGTLRHLVWSPRSNLITEQDPNGTVITCTYDTLDRLVRRDVVPGPGVATNTTFETFAYDGMSRLVAARNDVSALAYAYDSLGNTIRVTQDGLTTTYVCDSLGNPRVCTCPIGRHVYRTYGPGNHVTGVDIETNGVVVSVATFAYDGPGRLARITRGNGATTQVAWSGLQGTTNAAGDSGWKRVATISHATASNVIDARVFSYDASQHKTLRAQTVPFMPLGETLTNAWDYDALGRMRLAIKTKGTSAHRLDYTLDGKGNRIAVTNNMVPEPYVRDATMPDPADFQMDQYSDTPSGAFTYDAVGNRTGRSNDVTTFAHDYAGRLVSVFAVDGVGTTNMRATFAYDALGRRITKTSYPGGLPPETTILIRGTEKCDDGDPEIVELRKGPSASVLVGCGASAPSYAATGRLLAPPLAFVDSTGTLLYTCADDIGNVLALADASGAVLERYEYGDFGEPSFLAADGSPLVDGMGLPATASPAGNPFLFRAMQWDAETLLYMDGSSAIPSRAMDPLVGQYLGRDARAFGWGGSDRAFSQNSPWVLKKEEGGRRTPFHNGDIPSQDQFARSLFGKAPEMKGHVTLIK